MTCFPSPIPVLAAIVALALSGCRSPVEPAIARIYAEAALEEVRNPVIVIHGILGARLVQRSTDKVVWGAFTREGLDPNDPEGARAIALPLEIPASAHDYDPDTFDVHPTGPLDRLDLSLLFQVVSVDVYAAILRTLGAGGYTDVVHSERSPGYAEDHYTCFTFFYDWRRDNVENAIRFDAFLKETRKQVDASARNKIRELRESGKAPAFTQAERIEAWLAEGYRFDVVAHSMGGLLARYYLRYGATDLPADGSTPVVTWKGADEIDRLLVIAAPSLGSLDSLERLTNGFKVAFFLPRYDPVILGSMPAIYQLLPRQRHRPLRDPDGEPSTVPLFDPETWRANRWGLLSEDAADDLAVLMPDATPAERTHRADTYLAWCLGRAEHFHRALDVRPDSPSPTEIFLFAGDAQPTAVRVGLRARGDGTVFPDFGEVTDGPGDGTVARYSALADERHDRPGPYRRLESPVPWAHVTFLNDDHVGLTSNVEFSDNSLHILLERPPRDRARSP